MELKKSSLDLEKWGLSELKSKDVRLWTDSDYVDLLNAYRKENMGPQLPILFNAKNVERLLAIAHCRRCGACCEPNPEFLHEPGVVVFDKELKRINKLHEFSWKQLKKKTTRHESEATARYIPFPCTFHEKNSCLIYDARPLACRIYPLTNYPLQGNSYIAVNVRCDYGGDIYLSAMEQFNMNRAAFL